MDTLATLLEQAEAERNLALLAFNQARARLAAARAQAEQLDDYRADYRQRWHAQFARGAALEIVRCYQGFADRLEQAITQQQLAMNQAGAAQARANDNLTAHELRVAAVRKLIERRQRERMAIADRHEQRAGDEAATQAALRNNGRSHGQGMVRP